MSEDTLGFSTPLEVIAFVHDCLALNDPELLYGACSKPPSSFWRDPIFRVLLDIEQSQTLQSAFLDARRITRLPEGATAFTPRGCNPRTRHLHIDLE